MIPHTEPTHPVAAPCPPRSVALVGRYVHQHLQDAMLSVGDCDVVFVESTAHAYSRIKHVLPDLVVVYLSSDDLEGCQVLSMLALDDDTSQIPVLTFVTPDAESTHVDGDPIADSFICHGPTSLN